MATYPGDTSGPGGGGGGDMDSATYDPSGVEDNVFNPAFHGLGGNLIESGDSPYDMSVNDDEAWIAIDASNGPVTILLPEMDGPGPGEYRRHFFMFDNSNSVEFQPFGSESVDGETGGNAWEWEAPNGSHIELIGIPVPGEEWQIMRPSGGQTLFGSEMDAFGGAETVTEALENLVQYFLLNPEHFEFAADGGNSIEARASFPGASTEVEAIYVGPIGAKGTGTFTFEKGMQGGTNLLTAASYDVSTATGDELADVGALSATPANYQGDETDVVLVTAINCDVPHLVKITFKRQ